MLRLEGRYYLLLVVCKHIWCAHNIIAGQLLVVISVIVFGLSAEFVALRQLAHFLHIGNVDWGVQFLNAAFWVGFGWLSSLLDLASTFNRYGLLGSIEGQNDAALALALASDYFHSITFFHVGLHRVALFLLFVHIATLTMRVQNYTFFSLIVKQNIGFCLFLASLFCVYRGWGAALRLKVDLRLQSAMLVYSDMTQQQAIKIFEESQVRTLWDSEQEEWYFSIVDVVQVLTDSPNPRKYWSVLKARWKVRGLEKIDS